MPSDTRYSDAEVEAWVAEKYPMRGHRTGEMLRALLADRRRAEAELDIHRRAVDEAEAMIARLDGDRTDLKNIMREQGRIHDHVVSVLKADIAALLGRFGNCVNLVQDEPTTGPVCDDCGCPSPDPETLHEATGIRICHACEDRAAAKAREYERPGA